MLNKNQQSHSNHVYAGYGYIHIIYCQVHHKMYVILIQMCQKRLFQHHFQQTQKVI